MLNLFRKRKSKRKLLQWNFGPPDEKDDFQVLVSDEDAAAPEENVEKAEQARKISEVLKVLSPKHREVVLLRFYEGRPYREIAEIVGVSEGTVKSRLHHALKQIGGRLQELKPSHNQQ
jgi:RNA polymerase sigma-70 factor (ECF subfamily)